jgi:hypothetical protein
MPDTREDKAVLDMEADIRTMASRLAPAPETRERPKLTTGGLESRPGPIGAGAVGKRLESLLKRSQELAKQAEVLAIALTGVTGEHPNRIDSPVRSGDHLFGRQMAALDEISAVMDSLGRSLERAQRALG